MTIVNTPCFLLVYNPFTKIQQSEVLEIPQGTTIISNYNDVGLSCYIGATQASCDAKIIELNLIPITSQI